MHISHLTRRSIPGGQVPNPLDLDLKILRVHSLQPEALEAALSTSRLIAACLYLTESKKLYTCLWEKLCVAMRTLSLP